MTLPLHRLMCLSAAAAWPHEACGLVLRAGRKTVPVVCQNISTESKTQFLISTKDYCEASSRGEIVGVWHTHVGVPSTPSGADLAGCEASGVPWFILSAYKNEAGEFHFSEIEKVEPSGFEMPYVGRPYVFGVLDCWSLVRDYYRREFQIHLDDFPRIPEFWNTQHRFFEENWQAQGFVEEGDVLTAGNLLMFRSGPGGPINHIAIYVGDGQILHHADGRLSRHDSYNSHWQKLTSHNIRHTKNAH